MKVDEPIFYNNGTYLNGCLHCPFTAEDGWSANAEMAQLCAGWQEGHNSECPNSPDEYAAACALAEAAEKGAE